tara:strand:+ start:13365 stop:14291 length:927 start_codon:yes stop_codon:yes gene_type:complete
MLSLKRGREIAKFNNKKNDKVYIYGENEFDNKQQSENVLDPKDKVKIIPKWFWKDNHIKWDIKEKLQEYVLEDYQINQVEPQLKDIFEELLEVINIKEKRELDFTDTKDTLFPIPQKFSERIYVPAPSGSGKSTWIGMYLKQLRIKYPNRKIYIFSRVEKDEPLDKFKNTKRINLEDFAENTPQIETFENSILIFDDIDTILKKNVVKVLRNFRDDVLETGRHYGITCISTSHIITNYHSTRALINEANIIVLFPRGASFHQVRNFLDRYLGFDKNEIEMVRKVPSRWVYIWKEYPKYLIHEKGVLML